MSEIKNNPYIKDNKAIKTDDFTTKMLALISSRKLSDQTKAWISTLLITLSMGGTIYGVANYRFTKTKEFNELYEKAPKLDANDLFRNIKTKYGINNYDNLNDTAYMIKIIEEEVINNPNLSKEDKKEILLTLNSQEELINKAFNDANQKSEFGVTAEIKRYDNDYESKINIVKSNAELMEIINYYADYFYLERDILISLVASSIDDNGKFSNNIMNVNEKVWSNEINGNWHINTAKGEFNLYGFKIRSNYLSLSAKDQIYLGSIILSACLKDSGGNYYTALNKYYLGLYSKEQSNDFANEICNYLLSLRKGEKTELTYYTNDMYNNVIKYITTIKSDQYKNDFIRKWEILGEDITKEYKDYEHSILKDIHNEIFKF